ncbi:DUF4097 family beta strand repeat-containing protein [Nonomuraea sp. NPDC048826]|uniref:DUF4097 family beta strand repeat-containing protein n=1 Tax=Nonomuraea sp. NPDC048826 TaxID=3364347 RepID=UPI003721E3B9
MKRIALAGGLLASAALLTGCGLGGLTGPGEQDKVSYEVTEKVTKLEVRNGSGDTLITETWGGAVKVDETLHWRGDKPKTEHTVNGDTLLITYECARAWGDCGVNYKIEIPKGLEVVAKAGSGDVTLRSLSGPLVVTSGSGTVDATGLTGKTVTAEMGSGDLKLEYAAAPDDAQLETGSGSVVLRLPDEGYDVDAEVGSGEATVSVRDDQNAPRKVKVSAGSGDVSVQPR